MTASSSTGPVSSAPEGSRPLDGMKFVIAGKLGKSKDELTKAIRKLGGDIATKVDKTVAAVISNKGKTLFLIPLLKKKKIAN